MERNASRFIASLIQYVPPSSTTDRGAWRGRQPTVSASMSSSMVVVRDVTDSAASLSSLPVEIITHILRHLTFEELSFIREVSKIFDVIARSLLNTSFFRLGEQLETAMSGVKRMLPKRESQRRNHSLSRVNEVYSALETRYALLGMTFRKYIDDDSCCFIAGKVLDEAFAVLHTLEKCIKCNEQPRETQELLKDIRDYSSMAMEYFDENIAPTLRTRDPLNLLYRSRSRYSPLAALTRTPSLTFTETMHSLCNTNTPSSSSGGSSSCMNSIAQSVWELGKIGEWRKNMEEKLRKQERTIAEQDRLIREQSATIDSIVICLYRMNSKVSLRCIERLKVLKDGVSSLEAGTSRSVGRSQRKRSATENSQGESSKKHKSGTK